MKISTWEDEDDDDDDDHDQAGTWYIPYKATFWNRAKDANKGREAASSMV